MLSTLLRAVLLGLCLVSYAAADLAVAPTRGESGVAAHIFDMSLVQLTSSRWMDNQGRTLNYLKSVDMERMLYVFRQNHKLSTNGATANGGWDAPNFPFRSHMQGHLLTAWANCWSSLRDTTCRSRASYFVAELAKCQKNNGNAGFSAGYLSGFPESDITALEKRTLTSGNVPYYVIHKTMAGLLDVWRHIGDTNARDVLLSLATWVWTRTGKLSYSQMQGRSYFHFHKCSFLHNRVKLVTTASVLRNDR